MKNWAKFWPNPMAGCGDNWGFKGNRFEIPFGDQAPQTSHSSPGKVAQLGTATELQSDRHPRVPSIWGG